MIATCCPSSPDPDFSDLQRQIFDEFLRLTQKIHQFRALLPMIDPRRVALMNAARTVGAWQGILLQALNPKPSRSTFEVTTLICTPTGEIVVL